MRIRWLKTALSNFDRAMSYIVQEDEELARKINDLILKRIETLSTQPKQGRPGRIDGTRELVISKYPFIIPYRLHNEEIQILRVFHTSQKPPLRW